MENLRRTNKPPLHQKAWGAANAVKPVVARKPAVLLAVPEKKRSSSVQV